MRGTVRIGVISDTHGLLRPQAADALRGVDGIVHAGDIGSADILPALERIAPVAAIRGNNDRAGWAALIPDQRVVEYAGKTLYLLHDRNELRLHPPPEVCDVIITGHSHRPAVERRDGVLYLNPGSAGPRRFKLPVTVAVLSIGATLDAQILELPV
ncbi:MAG TPA: metallophosphoesterase family protein [Burkholderiales bacterium]|nr:metallophosphoesterase family protein [Burkholderiales bacterium]